MGNQWEINGEINRKSKGNQWEINGEINRKSMGNQWEINGKTISYDSYNQVMIIYQG
jgi:hypothetical protein